MFLCLFSLNLAIHSEGRPRVQSRLFHLLVQKIEYRQGQGHENTPFGCPNEVSVQAW